MNRQTTLSSGHRDHRAAGHTRRAARSPRFAGPLASMTTALIVSLLLIAVLALGPGAAAAKQLGGGSDGAANGPGSVQSESLMSVISNPLPASGPIVTEQSPGSITLRYSPTFGVLQVGTTVRAILVDDDDPLEDRTYEWFRVSGGVSTSITSGAVTGEVSYTATTADIGYYLRVAFRYRDSSGPNQFVSRTTPYIVYDPTVQTPGVISVRTTDLRVGTVLHAGLDDVNNPDYDTLTWQWQRPGATPSSWVDITMGVTTIEDAPHISVYTVAPADVGGPIRVIASYDDSLDTGQTVTRVTNDVLNSAPRFDEHVASAREYLIRRVAENSPGDTNVGAPFSATDPDDPDGDDLRYFLTWASPGGHTNFNIDNNGQLTVKTGVTLNYEGTRRFGMVVYVHDGKDANNNSDTSGDDFRYVYVDLIDSPVFDHGDNESLTVGVLTGTAGGTDFGKPVSATDPAGGAVTYTLGGTDMTSFAIDSSSGQLSLASAHSPNINTKSSYDITVTATDASSDTNTIAVTVEVYHTCPSAGAVFCSNLRTAEGDPNVSYIEGTSGSLTPTQTFALNDTTYTITTLRQRVIRLPGQPVSSGAPKPIEVVIDGFEDLPALAPGESFPKEIAADEIAAGGLLADFVGVTMRRQTGGYGDGLFAMNQVANIAQTSATAVRFSWTDRFQWPASSTHKISLYTTPLIIASNPLNLYVREGSVYARYELNDMGHEERVDSPGDLTTFYASFGDPNWSLSGTDADKFGINEMGVLSLNEGLTLDADDPAAQDEYSFDVTAANGIGGSDTVAVTLHVVAADEPGVVTFDPQYVALDQQVTATLDDPDGTPQNVGWQWEHSTDFDIDAWLADPRNNQGTWEDIMGATSAAYTPVAADNIANGDFLIARVEYEDDYNTSTVTSTSVTDVTATTARGDTQYQRNTSTTPVTKATAEGGEILYPGSGTTPLYETQMWPPTPYLTAIVGLDNVWATRIVGSFGCYPVTDPDFPETWMNNLAHLVGLYSDSSCGTPYPRQAQAEGYDAEERYNHHGIKVTAYPGAYRHNPDGSPIYVPQRAAADQTNIRTDPLPYTETANADAGQTTLVVKQSSRLADDGTGNVESANVCEYVSTEPLAGHGDSVRTFYVRTDFCDAIDGYKTLVFETETVVTSSTETRTKTLRTILRNPIGAMQPPDPGMEPFFTDDSTTRAVAENTPPGEDIGTPVTAENPANATLTYALLSPGSRIFDIDSSTGQLRTRAALNYETRIVYNVVVTVTDNNPDDSADDSITVVISVTDVSEADSPGTVTLSTGQPQVGEEITASLLDRDGGIENLEWHWESSADGSTAWTDVSGATDASYEPVSDDAGNFLRAVADYDDSHGDTKSAVTQTAAGVNTPPTFTGAPFTRSVDENTASGQNVAAAVAATDADSDTLTYSLGGDDERHFNLDSATGQITTRLALNFEERESYSVTVTASDGNGGSATAAVTVDVGDVEEPPGRIDRLFVHVTSSTSLRVSWTPPENTGPALDNQSRRFRVTGGGAWDESSIGRSATSNTISGLQTGVEYEVQIRAESDEGNGPWSDSVYGTPVPGPLTDILDVVTNPQFPHFKDSLSVQVEYEVEFTVVGKSGVTAQDVTVTVNSTDLDSVWVVDPASNDDADERREAVVTLEAELAALEADLAALDPASGTYAEDRSALLSQIGEKTNDLDRARARHFSSVGKLDFTVANFTTAQTVTLRGDLANGPQSIILEAEGYEPYTIPVRVDPFGIITDQSAFYSCAVGPYDFAIALRAMDEHLMHAEHRAVTAQAQGLTTGDAAAGMLSLLRRHYDDEVKPAMNAASIAEHDALNSIRAAHDDAYDEVLESVEAFGTYQQALDDLQDLKDAFAAGGALTTDRFLEDGTVLPVGTALTDVLIAIQADIATLEAELAALTAEEALLNPSDPGYEDEVLNIEIRRTIASDAIERLNADVLSIEAEMTAVAAAWTTVDTAITDARAAAETENAATRADAIEKLANRLFDGDTSAATDMADTAEADYVDARRTQSVEAWQEWMLTLIPGGCYTN